MSTTTTIPTTVPTTPAINRAVADAQSLPDLVGKVEQIDPALATAMNGKALIATRSAPGVVIVTVLTWASTHYGFHWDDTTVNLITLGAVAISSYLMRYVTSARITGIFSKL